MLKNINAFDKEVDVNVERTRGVHESEQPDPSEESLEATGLEARRSRLRPNYRYVSLVIVGLAALIAAMAVNYGLGTFQRPGPGMWPLLVAIAVGICGIVLLITERDGSDYEALTKRSWIVILGFGIMAAYIVGFTYIGMTITSLLFSLIWLKFIAKESWRMTWIASVAFTVAFVGIFVILLKVPIPHDPIVSLITRGRL